MTKDFTEAYQERIRREVASDLSHPCLLYYFLGSLDSSLQDLGFSSDFLFSVKEKQSQTLFFGDLDALIKKYRVELISRFDQEYCQATVPEAYRNYFFESIPQGVKKVLDLGCGTGILGKTLQESRPSIPQIHGVDINEYPEWMQFQDDNLTFEARNEGEMISSVKEFRPDLTFILVALHHMDFETQERYMGELYDSIERGSKVIILEDAYSTEKKPEFGLEKHNTFMDFNQEERQTLMSAFDWFANRVLARRETIPFPFAYRTMEGWNGFFQETGFQINESRYVGFPEMRDVQTPQSVFVLEK